MGQKVNYIVNGHVLATPKISNAVHNTTVSTPKHVKIINKNIQISYQTPTMTVGADDTLYQTNTPASEQIGPS